MDTGEIDEQASAGNGNAEPDPPIDHYVEKIEAAAEKFSPVAGTLRGDLRDFVLDLLRTLPETWAKMTEAQQRERAQAVDRACKKLLRDAVALLETNERVTIECLLEEVGFKPKGIVAKLGLTYAEPGTRHALCDAQGKKILIVVADAAQYMGERASAAIDKQQPDLPLAADPFAAGKEAAERGFNETRNPFGHPSVESAEWLRGHAEGEQRRLATLTGAAAEKRGRRRTNGPATS